MSALLVSCSPPKIDQIDDEAISKLPTEEIVDFKINYSELGSIRNTISAKLVQKVMINDSFYYRFPHGLYAASYQDSIMQSDLLADSARYRQEPEFFVAQGHVVIRNLAKNMRLETEGPLYWDAIKKEIYTDAFTLIIKPPDTIPATNGIVADDRFMNYTLKAVRQGVIYRDAPAKDSTQTPTDQ